MIKIHPATAYKNEITGLLKNAGLPYTDIPVELDNFVAAFDEDKIVGAAGVEFYGSSGLLRSVVVDPEFRAKGIAAILLAAIESLAARKGATELLLLTETAADYFARKGFRTITRNEVPDLVKTSSEFAHVCPVSAFVMRKSLV